MRNEKCIGNAPIKVEVPCSADDCLCEEGRYVSHEDTPWEVVICSACHSQGTHKRCSNILINEWQCEECQQLTNLEDTGWAADHLLVKIEENEDVETEESSDWSSQALSPKVELCKLDEKTLSFYQNSSRKKEPIKYDGKEKRFECNYDKCTKTFKRSSYLKVHQRTHTGENPYICNYDGCTKSFKQSSNLIEHQRGHTGDKPYKCNYDKCTKSFSRSSYLKIHKRAHTGEKPYKCNYDKCTKSFVGWTSLMDHQRTHTGDKPYKCNYDQCTKSFNRLSVLRIHQRSHGGKTLQM